MPSAKPGLPSSIAAATAAMLLPPDVLGSIVVRVTGTHHSREPGHVGSGRERDRGDGASREPGRGRPPRARGRRRGRADRRVGGRSRSWSRSTAPRRSRSRRCRSPASATTSPRSSSRSPVRPTAPSRRSSRRRAACSSVRPRPRPTSSSAPRRAAARACSRTTARASTRASSPSAAPAAGRSRATGWRPIRCSSCCSARSRPRPSCHADEVPTAVDGCGVLTFGMTPRADGVLVLAPRADSRAAGAIVAAMTAHPGLIGYERGATDTDLMRLRPGLDREGRGGGADLRRHARRRRASRSRSRTGTCARCGRRSRSFLGLGDEFGAVPVLNSRGERVGEVGDVICAKLAVAVARLAERRAGSRSRGRRSARRCSAARSSSSAG